METSKTPRYTLADLAARVGGQVVGDSTRVITGVADPASAGPEALVFLAEAHYAATVAASGAGAVVTKSANERFAMPQLVVPNVRVAMAQLMPLFAPARAFEGIHPSAVIAPDAQLGANCAIGPHVVVGEGAVIGANTVLHPGVVIGRQVRLGRDCMLYPRVVIYDEVTIGDRVILHAGTVVGSDGYGFATDATGRHMKIPQLGNVILGDDVEAGANCAIDRGTFGSTVVGRGTKIDNLVHIGHNDQIGEDCLIVSQTGISGSVRIGNRVTLAGQVGVAGHLAIGDGALVLARSGVTKDIPARQVVSGFPARPHKDELKRQAVLGGLEQLRKDIHAIKAQLGSVQHALEEQPYDH